MNKSDLAEIRKQADSLLVDAMNQLGVPLWQQHIAMGVLRGVVTLIFSLVYKSKKTV